MRATFRRGDASVPRGHALVYFRDTLDPDLIRASYVVVAPIEMDFAKYVPPMFAAQLSGMMPSGPAAIPLPPIPEQVESLRWVERLADARDDDLLDGGALDASDPQQMMMLASAIAGEYAALWTQRAAQLAEEAPSLAEEEPAALPDVEDILLSVMSDAERVSRLAKLAGTLRYAVELRDEHLTGDTVAQMERIGRYLPESYRLADLLAAGRRPDPGGARLFELLIERCYKLAAGEYGELERIDCEIAELGAAED